MRKQPACTLTVVSSAGCRDLGKDVLIKKINIYILPYPPQQRSAKYGPLVIFVNKVYWDATTPIHLQSARLLWSYSNRGE
jgi:hypothetical protein